MNSLIKSKSLIKGTEKDKLREEQNLAPKRENGILIAILGILTVVAISLAIANVIVSFSAKTSIANNTPSDTNNEEQTSSNIFDMQIDSLDKEQTIEALRQMQKPGYMPKDYADPALALNEKETYITLDYSYDTLDDIKDLDYHVSKSGKNELIITPVGDYYAIVSTDNYYDNNPSSGITLNDSSTDGYWPKAISFNKKYVNYYYEAKDNKETGSSGNDKTIFTDISPESVRVTLPVYALNSTMTQPSSIFSYNLEENEQEYKLTLYCIGVGIDKDAYMSAFYSRKSSSEEVQIKYAITHYYMTMSLDKATREPKWMKHSEDGLSKLTKSFSLNDAEAQELLGY